MTQRERLIELLDKCIEAEFPWDTNNGTAEFLLENGVIVPPCKVGDKVYFLNNRYEKQGRKMVLTDYVATGEVDNITIGEAGVPQLNVCYDGNEWIKMLDAGDFGNIAFLTKEEAEKALSEGENNG